MNHVAQLDGSLLRLDPQRRCKAAARERGITRRLRRPLVLGDEVWRFRCGLFGGSRWQLEHLALGEKALA